MIWVILAFAIVVYLICTARPHFGDCIALICVFAIFALFLNFVCGLFCLLGSDDVGVNAYIKYDYDLIPISEEEFVHFNKNNTIVVRYDDGNIASYRLENCIIDAVEGDEVPHIYNKKVTSYSDFRVAFNMIPLIPERTFITLPTGIFKPIT